MLNVDLISLLIHSRNFKLLMKRELKFLKILLIRVKKFKVIKKKLLLLLMQQ